MCWGHAGLLGSGEVNGLDRHQATGVQQKTTPPTGDGPLNSSVEASAFRLGLAHGDATTHPFNVLEVVDRRGFIRFIRQVDEGEAPLAAGFTVQGHGALAHFAVLAEEMDEVLSLSIPGEISNEDRQKFRPERRSSPPSHMGVSVTGHAQGTPPQESIANLHHGNAA